MQIIKAESTCLCCEGKTAWKVIAQGATESGAFLILQSEGTEERQPAIMRIEYEAESAKLIARLKQSVTKRKKNDPLI